jgi:hypothetical protein
MPEWFPNISRTLSLVVACVYLGITIYFAQHAKLITDLLIIGSALLFPLACIWFGDEMGQYYGTLPGPAITRTSPGWMVKLGGWLLLLLPAILYPFVIYMS